MKPSRFAPLGIALTLSCLYAPLAHADRGVEPATAQKATGGMRPSADAEPDVADAMPFTVENYPQEAPASCTNASISFKSCDDAWYGKNNPLRLTPDELQQRDDMYALLSLAVVNEDWQYSAPEAAANPNLKILPRRGHNVGGVMVDDKGQLVWWDRNSNSFECSGTNHGETRMMISYLKYSRRNTLACHTIYTSLEPCAMCSGVMTLQGLGRTIYVQKDHGYGAAIERLQKGANQGREFACGYPQVPISRQGLKHGAALELDRAYHAFWQTKPGGAVTLFLQMPSAHAIYQKAEQDLFAMKPLPGNVQAFQNAMKFITDLRTIYAGTFITPEMHVTIERNRAAVRAARPGVPEIAASFRPTSQQIIGQLDPCCRPPTLAGAPLGAPFVNPTQPLPAYCPAVPGSAAGSAALNQAGK